MFKSIKYVIHENVTNIYRIYTIAKYELLGDMRDSKLGIFWNFANPAIQILTYYFVFGIVLGRGDITDFNRRVPFVQWMLCGMVVWFFISPCITKGANAIYAKKDVITKMRFPVSILPATEVCQQLFNHFCLMILLIIFLLSQGVVPTIDWLWLFYYLFCGICLGLAIVMVVSVLNMITRDVRKFILASMRLLLYLTPILWSIKRLDEAWMRPIKYIMKINPIYYIVCGYRDCFIYHFGPLFYWKQMIVFWIIVVFLFAVGSLLMYKFKHKFIDLL